MTQLDISRLAPARRQPSVYSTFGCSRTIASNTLRPSLDFFSVSFLLTNPPDASNAAPAMIMNPLEDISVYPTASCLPEARYVVHSANKPGASRCQLLFEHLWL